MVAGIYHAGALITGRTKLERTVLAVAAVPIGRILGMNVAERAMLRAILTSRSRGGVPVSVQTNPGTLLQATNHRPGFASDRIDTFFAGDRFRLMRRRLWTGSLDVSETPGAMRDLAPRAYGEES